MSNTYTNTHGNTPVTELHNDFSKYLDGSLPAVEFIRILKVCDSQVFSGWSGEVGLLDEEAIFACENVAYTISQMLRRDAEGKISGKVVMTGCGTSGRIAFLTARRFNALLGMSENPHTAPFTYLCAGGDSALLLSDELPEDDPVQGAAELADIVLRDGASSSSSSSSKNSTYLIGVTCGLSAPYVAGQIDYTIDEVLKDWNSHKESKSSTRLGGAILGFNPVSLARDKPIEKFDDNRSFRTVALRLASTIKELGPDCGLQAVTPVIGPEPVAGSSRMKGGSATLVLLDAICMRAIGLSGLLSETHSMYHTYQRPIDEMILNFQNTHARSYMAMTRAQALPQVMEQAAESLRHGGRVYYIGAGSAGIVGFIDASEMPDTYGSSFHSMRGFVQEGWSSLNNIEGDIANKSPLLRLSLDHFKIDIIPTLTMIDTVIFLFGKEESKTNKLDSTLADLIIKLNGHAHLAILAAISFLDEEGFAQLSTLKLSCSAGGCIVRLGGHGSIAHDGMFDFALKIMTNAVSTYAQALGRGALFRGLMISTGPANDKIYQRCVNLIATTIGVSIDEAERHLIGAIYKLDHKKLDSTMFEKPRSDHIKASILSEDERDKPQICLPLALLTATGRWTISEAIHALSQEPRVSKLLQEFLSKKSPILPLPSNQIRERDGRENNDKYVIGVDVGGTNIRVGAFRVLTNSGDGKRGEGLELINKILTSPVDDGTFETVVDKIGKLSDQVMDLAEIHHNRVMAVGCGTPAHVDVDGNVSAPANLPWEGTNPLRRRLSERIGCENVIVLDDANAALLAEAQAYKSLVSTNGGTIVMLTLGTGIGCAVCFPPYTEVYTGSRGLVEAGHLIISNDDGLPCACGQKGCLEAYCSGPAIASQAGCSTQEVMQRVKQGDVAMSSIVDNAAESLAQGMIAIIRCYDPAVLVLGGGLAKSLFDRAVHIYKKLMWNIHDDLSTLQIVLATNKEPGVYGAAIAANAL
jgi:predicted NBD/HSP70 family sugar kinase/N-acetylmuramic acid 6-phosphate (MurNAc-6-P) etherase